MSRRRLIDSNWMIQSWVKYKCDFCKKDGHTEAYCFQKKYHDNQTEEKAVLLCAIDDAVLEENEDKKISHVHWADNEDEEQRWIGDSGASLHVTNSKKGMINIVHTTDKENFTMADGNEVDIECIGDVQGQVTDAFGKERIVTISHVNYAPKVCAKLFSITTAITKGMKLGNVGLAITLEGTDIKLSFDNILCTKKGYIAAMNMLVSNKLCEYKEIVGVSTPSVKMDITTMHECMGHPNIAIVKRTAKNWESY